VLDSHVVHWWSAEPERVSRVAARAIGEADELVIDDISWFELAWLARREHIVLTVYATAIENGWRLVTKDERLRRHRHPQPVAIW
jgi:PIN domain nuclease of toxin-antitoxin system